MVKELVNDILKEGKRQFNENLRLRDPIAHLENQVKLMYAHREISVQQYHQLIRKVHERQVGRGDLEILHKQAVQKNTASGDVTHYPLNPTVEQSLTHLALDRVRLEDIQHEAQAELESLKTNVDELHEQARQAQKTAQDKVKDEQAVRDLLVLKQDLLDRAHKLDERIHSLHQGLARLEALRKRLESYEAELKSLDIEERLTGLTLSVREETSIH
jgi:prefoldin subunit 5